MQIELSDDVYRLARLLGGDAVNEFIADLVRERADQAPPGSRVVDVEADRGAAARSAPRTAIGNGVNGGADDVDDAADHRGDGPLAGDDSSADEPVTLDTSTIEPAPVWHGGGRQSASRMSTAG